jgi:MFS family permease
MLLLLAAITYMDRVCISQMAGPIRADLGLDVRGMGLVFSAFSVAYALFEVPSGWLIDRYGPRWMLARIVFWWSLLTAATGLAGGLASLMMIRFLFGIGEAGAFPGVARVYDRWLPGMAHGRGFGIVLMAGTWSGFLTQPVVSGLMGHFSWRWVFAACALPGLVWAAVWLWWFRDDPGQHKGVNEAERRMLEVPADRRERRAVPWKRLLGSPIVWLLWVMYWSSQRLHLRKLLQLAPLIFLLLDILKLFHDFKTVYFYNAFCINYIFAFLDLFTLNFCCDYFERILLGVGCAGFCD